MKKTLLALAAITASSASFAQSSVTLYGTLDASLESVKGDKTVTRVSSDNLTYSRIGVKGSEDLGSGLKAQFTLEAPVAVDTGAAAAPTGARTFWSDAAWVGLAGDFGALRLGRIDTPIGDIAGNVLSAQTYDDLSLVGTRAAVNYRRADNAITYVMPVLVPGVSATLQYTTANGTATTAGQEVAGANVGKAYGLSVKYLAGPLSAGLGYENVKDDNGIATDGNQKANAELIYGAYDFGMAKVTAYFDAETHPYNAFATGERRLTVLGAKVAVPVSPEFTLIAGASQARNVLGSMAGDDNVEIITVKGIYKLSKRTSVYGMFTNVNNGTATTVGPADTSIADKTTHGIAVGMVHSF